MERTKIVKLGDVLNFKRGHDLPKIKMQDGKIPVAGSNGIIGYHNEETPIHPCITIGRSGNVGTPYIYDKCWAHNTVLYVDDFKGNDPKYLYYLLKTIPLSSFGGGSAVPTLNRNHIHPIEIKYFENIKTQKKIASFLSSLDDKIELNRRINENLEQQAQALFKSWFVDFEPFKDGKFVDSELGMIPEGWRVGVLADIANITMGQSPKGTSYNEIGDGISFYQGRAEFGNRFPSVRLFTTEPSRYAEPYSVLLSVRAPVGDINIAVERCCIGRGLASILSKNKHQSFVLYTMFFLKKELDKFNSEGTVFGSINRSSLENLKIIIPPVDIIDKFENLTSKIDVMLLNLFQETTSLAQLRDTLLPRLMSGELEIKDNSYD